MQALPSSSSPVESPKLAPAAPADVAMTVQQVLGQVALIQQILRAAMQKGTHYDAIPGCGDKPTLLKPGAEKLCLTFRLSPTYQVDERQHDAGHREYRVTATLTSIMTQVVIGQGIGSCSTMEAKYRYRGSEMEVTDSPVPRAYWDVRQENPAKAQELIGGKGFGVKKVEGQGWMIARVGGKLENPDLADQYNTVLKMAKKRALVDAVLTATAASDLFTQDLEDISSNLAAADGEGGFGASGKGHADEPPRGHGKADALPAPSAPAAAIPLPANEDGAWETVIHFGKNEGKTIRQLHEKSQAYYFDTWLGDREKDPTLLRGEDHVLFAALRLLVHGPQPAARPTDSPQDWTRLEGQVQKVHAAEGTKGNEKHTFYTVELLLADGSIRAVCTFNERFAGEARSACEDGTPMVAFCRAGRKPGSFELMNLVTTESDQQFEAAMDANAAIPHN